MSAGTVLRGANSGESFWCQSQPTQLSLDEGSVSWKTNRRSELHAQTFEEFVSFIDGKKWRIGCLDIEVSADGKSLLVTPDNINIPKSTLEEMLAALK